MRHELLEQLLADHTADAATGPSALDLEHHSYLEHSAPEPTASLDTPEGAEQRSPGRGARLLTAFDVADEDAEARSFARRRLLGVAAAGAGSTVALAAALALGL